MAYSGSFVVSPVITNDSHRMCRQRFFYLEEYEP